jgi:hypothetical protein
LLLNYRPGGHTGIDTRKERIEGRTGCSREEFKAEQVAQEKFLGQNRLLKRNF